MRTRSAIIIAFVALLAVIGQASGGLVMNETLGSQTILNDVLTTEMSLDYTLELGAPNGSLHVRSQTYIDPGDSNVRFYDYLITNVSGCVVYSLTFYGEQFLGGEALYSTWPWTINTTSQYVHFYDNDILSSNTTHHFSTGSSLTDSWGIGFMEFDVQDIAQPVRVGVLKPTTVPEPATLGLLVCCGAFGLLKRRRP